MSDQSAQAGRLGPTGVSITGSVGVSPSPGTTTTSSSAFGVASEMGLAGSIAKFLTDAASGVNSASNW